jgi:hypothetical protein
VTEGLFYNDLKSVNIRHERKMVSGLALGAEDPAGKDDTKRHKEAFFIDEVVWNSELIRSSKSQSI